jgi:oligopeptide/dipeptide ABC transporter ATP-binding protein
MTPLLAIDDLRVRFRTLDGPVQVLRGVTLTVGAGERVAVVGESGSGKSVTARAVLGLLPAAARLQGAIRFAGADFARDARAVQQARGRAISIIFQDPMAALNPVFTIAAQFRAVLERGAANLSVAAATARMRAALHDVAITDPDRVLASYSFQLSGGLNQRVMIAMALANNPRLMIADEPGTALDVTVQEQTLRLMHRLSEEHGAAVMLISHNLGVVRQFAQRVAVMYAGRIVEDAPVADIFRRPRHPYTRALIASVPRLSDRTLPTGIKGHVPDLRRLGEECPFLPRCPLARADCAQPVPLALAAPAHHVACIDTSALAA